MDCSISVLHEKENFFAEMFLSITYTANSYTSVNLEMLQSNFGSKSILKKSPNDIVINLGYYSKEW